MEYYPGYTYQWFQGITILDTDNCFTPTGTGSYSLRVIDDNGCRRTYSFYTFLSTIIVPDLDEYPVCEAYPWRVGWVGVNPFASSPCPVSIEWYFEGIYQPIYDGEHQIPYLGIGNYCAVVTVGGIVTERCFEVLECCPPNPEFSVTWHYGITPYTITVQNYPLFIPDYDQEQFSVFKDCNNDGSPGPWTLVEFVNRTDPATFGMPIHFDNLEEDCLYRVRHRVTSYCRMQSYVHTEYVGGSTGIVGQNPNQLSLQEQNQQGQKAEIFPNPSTGLFKLSDNEGIQELMVYDVQGKLVFQQTQPDYTIDLAHLPDGFYALVMVRAEGNQNERIVILRD